MKPALLAIVLAATPAWATDSEWSRDADQCAALPEAERQRCFGVASRRYQERVEAIRVEAERQSEADERAREEAAQKKARQRVADERAREATAQKKAAADRKTEPQRRQLAAEYARVLAEQYPNLNDISVRAEPTATGFHLIGRHSFLSDLSFDIGPQGPHVRRWAAKHAARLKEAGVEGVGVGSSRFGRTAVFYRVTSP